MNGIHRLDGDEIKNVSAAQTGVILLDAMVPPSGGTGKNYAEGEFAKIIPVTSMSNEMIANTNNREFTSVSGVYWYPWNPAWEGEPEAEMTMVVPGPDGRMYTTTTSRSDPQGAALPWQYISGGGGEIKAGETYIVSFSIQLMLPATGSRTMGVQLGGSGYSTPVSITITNTDTLFSHNDFGFIKAEVDAGYPEGGSDLRIFNSTSSAFQFAVDNVSVKQIISAEVSAKTIIGSDLTSSGQFSIIDSKPIILRDGMVRDDVVVENHHDRNAVYGTFDKVLVDKGRALVVPTTKYPVPRLSTINNQYSAQFDGVDDYIDAGLMSLYSDITISAWFKLNAFPSSGDKWNIAGQGNTYFGVYNTGAKTILYWKGRNISVVSGITALAIDTWYFCAVSQVSTVRGGTTLYLNGNQDDNAHDGSVRMTAGHFTIGAHDANPIPTSGTYFNGNIDEVSVWSIGMNKAEIGYYLCDYNHDTNDGVRPMDLSLHDKFGDSCHLWYRMGD